ncbi:hypothetical protein [Zoogloea sp.]|jgi:hypothetical protein|uniref:hypothetical protein n=1 Tax=Zoogloea sp. TaxID=49181 RepID=UPI001B655EC1|nr:hypothetical protein [Zoogloea sp.]MBK6654887.1 hypothetical protein [Zoogloea sp.]MBK7846379.1 hypothetical protein [Zoogloea sp.]MBP7446639.1 hypothetical protein [Zoogloea sp.]HOY00820.1 hypothetical protein [Zoogloea sp.]HPI59837.1 hypothetical protein [Zoogloea sp.]
MIAIRTILLATSALAALPAIAIDTPQSGIFSTPATVFNGNTNPPVQTISPDNNEISFIFQGLRIEQQGNGQRRGDTTHIALHVPLTIDKPTRIRAELRGAIVAEKGAKCRISIDSPKGWEVLTATQAPQAYLRTSIPVSASDGDLKLLISLRCTGRPLTRPVFIAEVDSLDLSLESRKSK